MCTRYAIINRVSELKVHIELTRFVQPEKIEIDANERAVNEKSPYCFFVCTTFDSFLNDLLLTWYHIFSSIASSSSFHPLFSLYTLLFTRCATSNASRHFKSPLAMGRDAFKPKHASSVSISGVIDTGVNSNLYATAISPTIPDEVSAP